MEVVVTRVAGLDVHKDTVMAAVRVPGEGGRARADGAGVTRRSGVIWRRCGTGWSSRRCRWW